jgi:hypothetical protein
MTIEDRQGVSGVKIKNAPFAQLFIPFKLTDSFTQCLQLFGHFINKRLLSDLHLNWRLRGLRPSLKGQFSLTRKVSCGS